ncbi:hypothetical protein PAXRUDRAFT_121219, partial [Paxillus rubicundulus Ve08.2h10]
YILKHGKQKAFHVGSNSSCCQHIWGHYNLYTTHCADAGLREHHHAVPCEIKSVRVEGEK